MTSLFNINKKIKLSEEVFCNSTIYYIDDFYENPHDVKKFILSQEAPLWKREETPSFNGIFFEDRRLEISVPEHEQVTEFFWSLCGEGPLFDPKSLRTNYTKFTDKSFNRFESHFWFPHTDAGYTAIIYLNPDTMPGTSLYEPLTTPPYFSVREHYEPWVSRDLWKCTKNLEAKFNRAVLFDGKKFPHGMAIEDDRFFHRWRLNQVIFFNGTPTHRHRGKNQC